MSSDIIDVSDTTKVNIESNSFSNCDDKIHFSQDTLDLSFQLISDASVGRITNFERTVTCLKFYRIYLSVAFRAVRIIIHLALVGLLILDSTEKSYQSTTFKVTLSIECLCLAFYSFQLFVVYKFSIKEKFLRDKKHYMTVIVILVSFIDIALFANGIYRFRISPALRVLLFINSAEQSQIRRHLRTLRITIINVLVIVPFLLTFYFMMVAFIYRYFKVNKTDSSYYYNRKPYMQDFMEIVWETLVYITSANSPDVMLPAFSKSPLLGILFLVFYAMFFFLLIFIYGLIMGYFRDNAKEEMRQLILGKLSLVYDAFLLLTENSKTFDNLELTENHSELKNNIVKKEKVELLLQRFKKYKNNKEAASILFSLLCQSNKPYLTKNEFMHIADLISTPLTMITNSLHFFEKHLWFSFSDRLADFVESKYFSILVAVIIVINSLCITFTNEPYTELFFTSLFLIEIFLRVYIKGFWRYFRSLWNLFDFVIILLAFVFWFAENMNLNIQTITFTLLVLRNLRLLKLLRGITAYHQLLHILGMLIPTISSLLVIVFCFTSLYVCIGIWSYHDLFYNTHTEFDYMYNSSNCNNTNLEGSDFGRLHYCILSFNSFLSGFQTLCAVSIGNNWHTITEGYELGSSKVIFSRIYFTTFKGVVTYLLLLIVAFVLDVFLLAYNQKGTLNIEEIINQKLNDLQIKFISYKNIRKSRKINDETDSESVFFRYFTFLKRIKFDETHQIWFRLKAKGARSVEYVTQAMFETEIERDIKTDFKYMHYFGL